MTNETAHLTAELMRSPLDSFTAARTAKVRELRQQGERDLADRVASLRKPSVALWAVNQAGAVASGELDAVRAAGEQLRSAQQSILQGDRSAAAAMERATQAQRRTIDTLTRRLGMVLTAAGYAASDETLRRIAETLRKASVGDQDTWAALADGRLTSEPEQVTFPDMDVSSLQRVQDDAAERGVESHQRRVEAAEAELRRAEEVERAAAEQEQTARARHRQAQEAADAARKALADTRSGKRRRR